MFGITGTSQMISNIPLHSTNNLLKHYKQKSFGKHWNEGQIHQSNSYNCWVDHFSMISRDIGMVSNIDYFLIGILLHIMNIH